MLPSSYLEYCIYNQGVHDNIPGRNLVQSGIIMRKPQGGTPLEAGAGMCQFYGYVFHTSDSGFLDQYFANLPKVWGFGKNFRIFGSVFNIFPICEEKEENFCVEAPKARAEALKA